LADGDIATTVKKIEGGIVTVEILNDGKLGSCKNMNLPGAKINLPAITKADEHDVISFGLKYKVNFIAVSYARSRKDIEYLRDLIIKHDPSYGPYIQIISKLENDEAIKNIDELI
jgi:pyruvate kinase